MGRRGRRGIRTTAEFTWLKQEGKKRKQEGKVGGAEGFFSFGMQESIYKAFYIYNSDG